ncbi:hypothetical protein [Streptomyces sp. NBC_01481]|uniref:hypothetical protein n=1 Tax=Streptomyces sp. NBC_01481 TaxID=2975869 RepID=UPI002259D8D3|nr:hypothetical protein [Streptomyces sp. NBC_01481]MCX4586192.1 hypothetical protein [Streptomyces sp. NBC_01481]
MAMLAHAFLTVPATVMNAAGPTTDEAGLTAVTLAEARRLFTTHLARVVLVALSPEGRGPRICSVAAVVSRLPSMPTLSLNSRNGPPNTRRTVMRCRC